MNNLQGSRNYRQASWSLTYVSAATHFLGLRQNFWGVITWQNSLSCVFRDTEPRSGSPSSSPSLGRCRFVCWPLFLRLRAGNARQRNRVHLVLDIHAGAKYLIVVSNDLCPIQY